LLGKLSLPELRHLQMYMAKGCDYHSHIKQTTLNELAKKCPKLLRLFGSNVHSKSPFIFAQRMNAATKFRLVHQIEKYVDGTLLQFDYDSDVVSNSTDEESVLSSLDEEDDNYGSSDQDSSEYNFSSDSNELYC
jgi:hypothetical protein